MVPRHQLLPFITQNSSEKQWIMLHSIIPTQKSPPLRSLLHMEGNLQEPTRGGRLLLNSVGWVFNVLCFPSVFTVEVMSSHPGGLDRAVPRRTEGSPSPNFRQPCWVQLQAVKMDGRLSWCHSRIWRSFTRGLRKSVSWLFFLAASWSLFSIFSNWICARDQASTSNLDLGARFLLCSCVVSSPALGANSAFPCSWDSWCLRW